MVSLRCKLSGCDLNDCGICRRCGSEEKATHDWADEERDRPCFRRTRCTRCEAITEKPDHDWEMKPSALGDVEMTCSRCGLKI